MADEYHTNNEYLKQIAGDETNEYHTNNEYLKVIAEQGGSGGGGITEERVLELLAAKPPLNFSGGNSEIENQIVIDGVEKDFNLAIIYQNLNGEDYIGIIYNNAFYKVAGDESYGGSFTYQYQDGKLIFNSSLSFDTGTWDIDLFIIF